MNLTAEQITAGARSLPAEERALLAERLAESLAPVDAVSVRRLRSLDDPDTDEILDLYMRLFPEPGTNYSPEDMLTLLDGSPQPGGDRHVQLENIVLTAKYRGAVVGFLLCHFYPERCKAIVSYYGIDRNVIEARRSAAIKLLSRLKRIFLDGQHPCDYLFFDMHGISQATAKEEARERKARPLHFRQSARRIGFPAFILQFPWLCPKLSLDHDSLDHPSTLMCVTGPVGLPSPIPRALVLEFLRFIILDCYGDYYSVSDAQFQPYQDYLQRLLKHYGENLPPEIEVL